MELIIVGALLVLRHVRQISFSFSKGPALAGGFVLWNMAAEFLRVLLWTRQNVPGRPGISNYTRQIRPRLTTPRPSSQNLNLFIAKPLTFT